MVGRCFKASDMLCRSFILRVMLGVVTLCVCLHLLIFYHLKGSMFRASVQDKYVQKATPIKCVQISISACTPEARPHNPNPGCYCGNRSACSPAEPRYCICCIFLSAVWNSYLIVSPFIFSPPAHLQYLGLFCCCGARCT